MSRTLRWLPPRLLRANGWFTISVVVLLVATAAPSPTLALSTARPAASAPAVLQTPPPGDYWVNFTENGLKDHTNWTVILNWTSNGTEANASTVLAGNVIQFAEPANLTYQFTVRAGRGYTPSPASGLIPNLTTNFSKLINFTANTYSLVFQQNTLPTGVGWQVDVNGSVQKSTGSSITFSEPYGFSYAYTVQSLNSSWTPNRSSGSGVLTNDTTITITFLLVTYHATFTETGLPSGTNWTVTVPPYPPVSSSTSSLVVNGLPNGTYTYAASSSNRSWSTPGGNFPISGSSVSIDLSFSMQTYTVLFYESGLPGSTLWNVTLGTALHSSKTSTISFNVPNGTYNFSVGPIAGWYDAPSSGVVNVSGAPYATTIVWTRAVSNVTFTEIGITTNTKWWVNISGPTGNTSHPGNTVTGNTIVLNLPNGTYAYTVAVGDKRWEPTVPAGVFTVNGADMNLTVTFFEVLASVTFDALGLPFGIQWWSNLSGGYSNSSTTSTLGFELPNGTYTFRIQAVNHSWAASGGNFTVVGNAETITVPFTNVLYAVTFNESGLAAGTNWSVELYGTTRASTGTSIAFEEPNGTFSFSVGAVPGYYTYGSNGTVTIRGRPVNLSLVFHAIMYPIRFNETGLSRGATWWVNVSWTNRTSVGSFTSTSSTGSIALSNGSYLYSVATANKSLTPEVPSGVLTVNGSGFNVSVTFVASAYPVTFVETGLPTGALWSVDLAGTTETSSTTSTIFYLTNGTYTFSVPVYGVFNPTPSLGNVTVDGMPVSTSINFTTTEFTITFIESGLPSGTLWSVTVNGVTKSTTTSTLAFLETKGTFPFLVPSVGGLTPTPGSGYVSVLTSATTITVSFGTSSPGGQGLTDAQGVLLVALLSSAIIILIALVLSWRRGPSPNRNFPPTPPPGAVLSRGTLPPASGDVAPSARSTDTPTTPPLPAPTERPKGPTS